MKRIRIQGPPGNTVAPTPNMAQRPMTVISQAPVRPSPVYMQRPPQQNSAQEPDAIAKAKAILPHLKEALVNLMTVASQNFAVCQAVDDMQKGVDSSNIPPFNKCLENFYGLCDQLELQLNLAHQQISQFIINSQQTPQSLLSVSLRNEPRASQIYASYVNIVEQQLNFAKDIHHHLTNCCKTLTEQQISLPTA